MTRTQKLEALAERPGTPAEGEAANAALARIKKSEPAEQERKRFTDKVVAALPVPTTGYKLYRDAPGNGWRDITVPGFGVRVMASGLRVFVLSYTDKHGRDGRITIGPFGPSPRLSVVAARERARIEHLRVKGGENPAQKRREERQSLTVSELCDKFLKDRGDKRPATVRMYTQIIKREIKPTIGRHKADAIQRSDIKELHAKIAKRAPYQANRVLATCKALFNFGSDEKIVTDNPVVGIDAAPEQKRKRYLNEEELARLHRALDALPNQRAADLFRLMLFTGARIGETLAAKWSDFDLGVKPTWKKPGSTTKTRTDHILPLNLPTRDFLRQMHKARPADTHLFGDLTYDAVKDDWKQVLKVAAIKDFRRHDLRHNFASALISMGFGLSEVGSLLGHSNPTTTARYAHLVDERLRAASKAAGEALFPRHDAYKS